MATTRRTVLKLRGRVPSKKNEWKRAGKGGIYFARDNGGKNDTRGELTALQLQAQSGWRIVSSSPAVRPSIRILLVNQGLDPDNGQTTVLDILKKAGVITDDRASALTPPLVCDWRTVRGGEQSTYVEIQESV